MVLINDKDCSRMEEKSQKLLQEFNSTLAFDRRLFYADIKVDFAYADALFNAGVLRD
jgi:argininosuccinate lyase